ncbi:MAG: type II toxin-antitoxin system YafQ family toxin [Clostridia bacterium]|nr:type II toxin-antitoxin system YafQ family toxin [Clostridia bacterium]
MRVLKTTAQFRRDYKRMKKRGKDMTLLEEVIDSLLRDDKLPEKYRDHGLAGEYLGYRECHIEPDWLLVYSISGDSITLVANRTGSHGDLFR